MRDGLKIEGAGEVQTFIIDRQPFGNSLSASLVDSFHAALDAFERDGGRVLILRGEGRNFCTGFDLTDAATASDGDLLLRFVRIEQLLARIWAAPYETIAVGTGRVMGAGADIFTACNYRIAVDEALFAFPGAAFGLVLGARRLAKRIGPSAARHLIESGKTLDAAAAANLGLATIHVRPAELHRALDEQLAAATRLDGITLRSIRRATSAETCELDHDMASLVHSAARAGLRERILAYRARSLQARPQALE